MKLAHLIVILFLYPYELMAQSEKKHAIDVTLQDCLDTDSNQTTHGMSMCELAAAEAWKIEMTNYYQKLTALLTADEKQKLIEAQKKWEAYRELEFEFSRTFYYDQEGSMWRIVAASRNCDLWRQRSLDLIEYYNVVSVSEK